MNSDDPSRGHPGCHGCQICWADDPAVSDPDVGQGDPQVDLVARVAQLEAALRKIAGGEHTCDHDDCAACEYEEIAGDVLGGAESAVDG